MSKVKLAACLTMSMLLISGCSTIPALSTPTNSARESISKLTPQVTAAYRAVLWHPIPNNGETIENFLETLGNDVGDTVYLHPYMFGDTVVVQIRFDQDFDIDFAYQNGKVEPADQVSQALLQGDVGQAFTDAMSAYESAQQANENGGEFFPVFIPMVVGGGGYSSAGRYSGGSAGRFSRAGRVSRSYSGRGVSSTAGGDD
ncbi:hypothetical protein IW967_00370 [Alicyclobacillus mali]|uniref:Lipoprotein n=1 Tax=Alicyclobacillus mali (ex Roth et al. 2021) TaxID=1123961 RepID=A0ABS0EZ81_9BACL|nr:hypothetical protein [Alicyclobacillus mali (ex Roth et al. 2021)]MBF8376347.1 hypothetical protein [Alicyclobacillus mali (ex Roth et al. 2021)]